MSAGDFSERLDAIDQNANIANRAELEYSSAMGRVHNYIEAVARDEVSLEILRQNPDRETGVTEEEVDATIKQNRKSLLTQLEDAILRRKEVLITLHQTELDRNKLFISPSDD
jgi:hypothetical protein